MIGNMFTWQENGLCTKLKEISSHPTSPQQPHSVWDSLFQLMNRGMASVAVQADGENAL